MPIQQSDGAATEDQGDWPDIPHFYYGNWKPHPPGMEKRSGTPPGAGAFAHMRGRRNAAPPGVGEFVGSRGRRWNRNRGTTKNEVDQYIDASVSRKHKRFDFDLPAAVPHSGFAIVRGKKNYQ